MPHLRQAITWEGPAPWRGGPWRSSRREFASGIGAPVQGLMFDTAGRGIQPEEPPSRTTFNILPASIGEAKSTACA